ncbi:MAG: hypothetical protein QM723_27615 [Myxococcaceae bacterium]
MDDKPKTVSLAAELAELVEALEGVRLLAELQSTRSLPYEEAVESTPRMLAAAVLLVVERLRLVRKVLVGAAAVGLLEHRNNRALPQREGDDPDLVLSEPRRRR